MVAAFVARLPAVAAELRAAADAGRSADLARAAHRLRGAGGSYGFPAISEAAAALENRLNGGEAVEQVSPEVHALTFILTRVDGYTAAA